MKLFSALLLLLIALPAWGQEPESEQRETFQFRVEVKTHYRWSEDSSLRLRFPFPPEFIPRGQTAVFARTVSPDSSLELSTATVVVDFTPAEILTSRIRVHFLDLYNRNPTSTDQTVNVKEAWVQLGNRTEFFDPVEGSTIYALLGKAPKIERQPDRNLESYGLVSTAFNRFEDHQLQLGGTIGSHFYWRAQVSTGNPVFFRDVNALAGDNGNDDFRFPNPELHLNSGFPILYDAEVEEVSGQNFETGGGLGLRWISEDRKKGIDLLGFYYNRDLADRVDLRGTFYGGDLDLLDGAGGISLPISGRKKEEFGGNIDGRLHGLRFFFQYVSQEMAGLKREGYEAEVLWKLDLPLKFASSGKQLFPFIQPVFRFSFIDNQFGPVPLFPAPSTFWDWMKLDAGIRLGIVGGTDLTIEYSFHDIDTPANIELDEFLTTLRFRF